jgi:UDP-glucose 4-epimerase
MTNTLAGKVCVIVGGGGFLGANLAIALRALGAEVRAFGRTCYFEAPLKGVHWMSGTLDDMQKLSSLIDGADVIFHLAGTSTPASAESNRQEDIRGSVLGTINLLDLCCNLGIERVVFTSSGGTVYGNSPTVPLSEKTLPQPISTYGINKLAAEFYFQLYNRTYGMKNVVLRIANPFGLYQHGLKNQGAIPIFARKALIKEPLKIWGDGSVTRDYLYAEDVAQAMIAAATYDGSEAVFNIGSGIGRSLNELIADLTTVLGDEIAVVYEPARRLDVPVSVLDCSLAVQELGWRAESDWLIALRTTCDWVRADIGLLPQERARNGD